MDKLRRLRLKDVVVSSRFLGPYIKMVREKVIPYQWEALNDRVPGAALSHCIKNFEIAAGRRDGRHYGNVFQDSDLYKWLESVAYSLESCPDAALEALADSAIELICVAQRPDGYINTYYTIKNPDRRFSNLREGHELYCAGHMIEAAVAYAEATGKRVFLDAAARFADYIDSVFGLEEGKIRGYPGHQEIEYALIKLSGATGDRRYLRLAKYFIRRRGAEPHYFDEERQKPGYKIIYPELSPSEWIYSQSHEPPISQKKAVGHAVRAAYMYAAMAGLAGELGDPGLLDACKTLYEDVEKQTYITGAIGSAAQGERFTSAYDLPNDLVYGETCASVGLMRFSNEMNAICQDARYIETVERALYNVVLAGISLNGTEFFYVNPLESDPAVAAANPNYRHVAPTRKKWFDCSCCPTNIARTLMGLGSYIYAASNSGLYVNLYCAGSARDGDRGVSVETGYPFGGDAAITAHGGRFTLYLRDPECAPVLSIEVDGQKRDIKKENGYIALDGDWDGETVRLGFDMRPKRMFASPFVQKNTGKTAVMRGPLVYCAEQADNGGLLGAYVLPDRAAFVERPLPAGFPGSPALPVEAVSLEAPAYKYRAAFGGKVYSDIAPELEAAQLKLIPYFLWANRGENEMRVYINAEHKVPDIKL